MFSRLRKSVGLKRSLVNEFNVYLIDQILNRF